MFKIFFVRVFIDILETGNKMSDFYLGLETEAIRIFLDIPETETILVFFDILEMGQIRM